MWICRNDAFLSAVKDVHTPNGLMVRARRKEHLEDAFPDRIDEIYSVPVSDYAWRIRISKFDFTKMLAEYVDDIEYDNFKDSVDDKRLKNFYNEVWWSGLYMQDQSPLEHYYGVKYGDGEVFTHL